MEEPKAKKVTVPLRRLRKESVLVSDFIVCAVAAIGVYLDSSTTLPTRICLVLISVIIALLGLARYNDYFNVNEHPKWHLIAYYLLIGTSIILLAPIGSPFVYTWFIVIFLTSFYFGLKRTIFSLGVLGFFLLGQQLWVNHEIGTGFNKDSLLPALIQFGVVIAAAIFFIDTEKATDQNRTDLEFGIDMARIEHQRIITLINSMADAVIATDPGGRITLYNAAALNIVDTNEDLTGKQVKDVLHILNEERKPFDVLALSKEKKNDINANNLYLQYADGEVINIWLFISQVRLGFGSNQEEGYIITLRDITREKSLEEERDEFISVISHELRTPVTITEASISNAQFIAEKNQDIEAVKTALKTAHDDAVYLANMLNDLSTLSRAERGKLDLNPEELSPRDLLETLASDYEKQASEKGLGLKVSIADDTPVKLISNHLYVREILQNFLTNALKYTKEGAVTLSVCAHPKGVKFSVSDTGIGISKTDQKKIFDKFFRSEDYRTKESSGTGLGLYITKKLAKIISAEFEIESQLNKGSTFSVIVPDLRKQADNQ